MAKLIVLGIAVFFIAGLFLENIVDNVVNNAMNLTADAGGLSTADRYIAAHREGKSIPGNPPADLPINVGEMSLEDCRAENLNPYTQAPVTGTVIRIVDGDTLIISIEGFEMPVRLWGIDAPEMTQSNGPGAQLNLEMLVPEGSRIAVHPVNKDRYGRMVGIVDNGGELAVNFAMVAQGWAYHYRQYDPRTNGCLAEAERAAQDSRMGVWQGGVNGDERPWEHRRRGEV